MTGSSPSQYKVSHCTRSPMAPAILPTAFAVPLFLAEVCDSAASFGTFSPRNFLKFHYSHMRLTKRRPPAPLHMGF